LTTMTMAKPKYFQPKGEKAEWEMIYDYLKSKEKGALISYKELSKVINRDFASNRSPIYRAMKEMEIEDDRSLLNVRGYGYKITIAQDHEGLAFLHHKKSRRQMNTAKRKITSADMTQLSQAERARFREIELALSQQAEMIKRLDKRVTVVEEKQKTQGDTTARLDKLIDALKRHGIEI